MKTNSNKNNKTQISKKQKFFFGLFSIFFALVLAFVIGEVLLRVLHIPGIQFDCSRFDPLVGPGLNPHSTVIYRYDNGNFVQRRVNSYGYLDVEHEIEKRPGLYRVGFFGDSYVEVRQVLLKDTYFRIVEKNLQNYNVECFAFGTSGFSTLQSYLNCQRWAGYFDLDLVVYVFCENDLGDQIKEINDNPNLPHAALTDDGFTIDTSFRERNLSRQKVLFKIGEYLIANSLVIATLHKRIGLLLKYGIKVKVSEEDRMMATKSQTEINENKMPNQRDLPSTWPDWLREYAEKLDAAIILKWRDEVEAQSRQFAIWYIPRASEMKKETKDQDSFKVWLVSLCRDQDISLIDPTSDLVDLKLSGKKVFHDHFTEEGHVAFAGTFVKWFIDNASKTSNN